MARAESTLQLSPDPAASPQFALHSALDGVDMLLPTTTSVYVTVIEINFVADCRPPAGLKQLNG